MCNIVCFSPHWPEERTRLIAWTHTDVGHTEPSLPPPLQPHSPSCWSLPTALCWSPVSKQQGNPQITVLPGQPTHGCRSGQYPHTPAGADVHLTHKSLCCLATLPPCSRTVLNVLTSSNKGWRCGTGGAGVIRALLHQKVCGWCQQHQTITNHLDQKHRLKAEVRSLLKTCDSAFRGGDASAFRAARRNLTVVIKRAKATYALLIQGHFSTTYLRSMWRAIKSMTDYTRRDAEYPREPSLPGALNTFHARLEESNTCPGSRPTPLTRWAAPHCTHQLSEVLTDIFNTSLLLANCPNMLLFPPSQRAQQHHTWMAIARYHSPQ